LPQLQKDPDRKKRLCSETNEHSERKVQVLRDRNPGQMGKGLNIVVDQFLGLRQFSITNDIIKFTSSQKYNGRDSSLRSE
jgi:hypothetical protein